MTGLPHGGVSLASIAMHVEIWSDIACPWCYIGKRRFERALANFERRDEVTVTWRSFELDPGAPPEREGDYVARLARKYGRTPEEARAMVDHIAQVAAADGIELRHDRVRQGSSFDAHRLLQFAAEHGRQAEMNERLLRAYHAEGELLADHATLTRLAGEAGLPEDEAAAMLASDRYADAVRADEALAQQFGLGAVPAFVVDRARLARGAQDPEVLLDMLRAS